MAADAYFSLSSNAYKGSLHSGLSLLQQNGEFVDMTLAADGHFVRVHQVIMALASPYIKQLISVSPSPNPVLFLNKISYNTLSYLLEYIYSGEVSLTLEQLNSLLEVARELHIMGLENMIIQSTNTEKEKEETRPEPIEEDTIDIDDSISYFEESPQKSIDKTEEDPQIINMDDISISSNTIDVNIQEIDQGKLMNPRVIKNIQNSNLMQYTVSNQGSLQMILNRFVYYLKHTNRDRSRQWRCVEYCNKLKCPAVVFTQDEMVLQRIASHKHPFHDKRILKKARDNAIFSAIHEAEMEGKTRKKAARMDEDVDE